MGENPNLSAKNGYADDDSVPFFNLPKDIFMHVFSNLSVNIILRCRCVCKQWRQLLCHPEFVRIHLCHSQNRQKFLLRPKFKSYYFVDYEAHKGNCDSLIRDFPLRSCHHARILGSCNGLVCVGIDQMKKCNLDCYSYKILLWNPLTGDYKMLPDANPLIDTDAYTYTLYTNDYQLVGFGYDSFIEDYKLVRVIFRPRYQVEVYSLKSNSWKVIETSPLRRIGISLSDGGIALNGSIYWLVDSGQGKRNRWIVGFDLKDDKFIEVQFPSLDPNIYCVNNLRVDGGCLGVYYTYRKNTNISYQKNKNIFVVMWTMKEDKKEEWTKLPTITYYEWERTLCDSADLKSLHFFENRKVVFNIKEYESKIECEVSLVYDPKLNSIVETIPFHGISFYEELVPYTESLVSPNAWEA